MADGTQASGFDDRQWRTEHRHRAVQEVLAGGTVAEVARQYGTSRQSLHTWIRRFEAEGYDGLAERSRRPKTSPTRLAPQTEALICELRRARPRWGPRRISHELQARGVADAPGRSTVYRVLVRNALVQHQALDMATPISRFRPVPAPAAPAPAEPSGPPPERVFIPQRRAEPDDGEAVEVDMVISPAGRIVLPGNNQLKFPAALGGHPVTIWADLRSIHVSLAGELIRTRQSRLTPDDLAHLRLRGRAAGPEPAASAAPRGPIPAAMAIEVDRTVDRDGMVALAGQRHLLAVQLSGQRVTLRLDRHLMHVIAEGHLVKTLPAPITPHQAARLNGARSTAEPLPAPSQGPVKVMRKIPADGISQVGGQRLRVGRAHAGKTVVIIAEDTVFRVLYNDIEIGTHARKNNNRISHLRATTRRS